MPVCRETAALEVRQRHLRLPAGRHWASAAEAALPLGTEWEAFAVWVSAVGVGAVVGQAAGIADVGAPHMVSSAAGERRYACQLAAAARAASA